MICLRGGSATYKGDAIGNVVSGGKQYTATGEMNMTWNFQPRNGSLNINNFDNKNFSFGIGADKSSPQQFAGALVNPNIFSGWVGAANGAFVGPPEGVIGNFGVDNVSSHYQATGIFGGVAVPHAN